MIASVNKELQWLLDKGYIRETTSSWASPMVTVKKPDGSARICIDFKAIDAVTTPLPFYMPRVEEVLQQVGKSTVISKLDLTKGYYQVPMSPGDIEKTAFVCHRGNTNFSGCPLACAMHQQRFKSSCKSSSGSAGNSAVPTWMTWSSIVKAGTTTGTMFEQCCSV